MSVNQIVISGNIATVEDTITRRGNTLTNLKLATERWTGKEEILEYHAIRFVNLSDRQRQLLQVGNAILVTGALAENTWRDEATQQGRRQTYVLGSKFELLRVSQGNDPSVKLNDLASMLQRLGISEEAADTMVLQIAAMNQTDRDAALARSSR